MAAKRFFDVAVAGVTSLLALPVLALIALGIKLSDRGPVLYRSTRAGRGGKPFDIVKFRTMRVQTGAQSQITSSNDSRVFPFGATLRKLKADELPQLWNVLVGQMSIVGPRPEAMDIVKKYYSPEHLRTLDVAPGLASPGSIYNYTHGEQLIGVSNAERDYVQDLLPIKLGLELVYVDRASLRYDAGIILRTIKVIALTALGRRDFATPPELEEASTVFFFPTVQVPDS